MTCRSECPRCGALLLPFEDANPGAPVLCEACRDRDRLAEWDAIRLFEPAPEQVPGQLELDRPDGVSTSTAYMHGMVLGGQDAGELVTATLCAAMDILDSPHTIRQGGLAMGWVAAALRDARALGACIEQMCAWTGYDRGQVAQLLGSR